ncbi:hypothetical protein [Antarcticirhabdus aurantiaca]|uniref:Uncharacterized protein n=1 Tax=Antarcticirhabdus aurantiaca TaxID=2606717 RepID=A0ACD4NWR9_9HYPH|nr:hypothetical protein OXU80_12405 [Jeongeuplla avenae]
MDDTERLVVLLEARIRDFEKNMQKASGTAGREFGRMRRDAKTASAEMEADMMRSASRINQAMAMVSTRAGAMAAAFAPVAGGIGIAAAALTGVGAAARTAARDIATIGDEAKRAGIGVKAFQELRFVAEQSRVSFDALTDGIKEMNLRADEFIVTGSGSGAEAFKRLGLSAADLSKKLKDPSALFTEIIGKMERMDRAAQIRIADEVFGGTGGEQFVQLIDQGAAGIRRTIEEANRLGIVMDEEMIAKAAEVDRQFGIISQTVGTRLKGAIVDAASALASFIDGFRDFENQQNQTLEAGLATLGQQRLDTERKILELRQNQRDLTDTAKGLGFGEANDRQIADLEAQNAALTEQEKKILDILKARGAFGTQTKETSENLRDMATAGTAAGEAAGYVARNGGAATTTTDAYGKSVADLRDRLNESVKGLQLTVDTFGQSEGAIAAARFEADAMAEALRAATAAGKTAVDPKLAGFIKDQAAEYGRLTDQISASTEAEQERQRVADRLTGQQERVKQLEGDINFERSIIGLPEAEQRIRSTLHGLDLEFNSFEGQRLAAGMRYNDRLIEMQEELERTGQIGRDAFEGVFDALMEGGDVLENITEDFAPVSQGQIDAFFATIEEQD